MLATGMSDCVYLRELLSERLYCEEAAKVCLVVTK